MELNIFRVSQKKQKFVKYRDWSYLQVRVSNDYVKNSNLCLLINLKIQ